MTTPEERDYIGEVIAEDAAERKGMITVMTSAGEACRLHPDDVTISFGSINADLRQQLADVSHERDLLRAALAKSQAFVEQWDDDSQEWMDLSSEISNLLCGPSAEVKS